MRQVKRFDEHYSDAVTLRISALLPRPEQLPRVLLEWLRRQISH